MSLAPCLQSQYNSLGLWCQPMFCGFSCFLDTPLLSKTILDQTPPACIPIPARSAHDARDPCLPGWQNDTGMYHSHRTIWCCQAWLAADHGRPASVPRHCEPCDQSPGSKDVLNNARRNIQNAVGQKLR